MHLLTDVSLLADGSTTVAMTTTTTSTSSIALTTSSLSLTVTPSNTGKICSYLVQGLHACMPSVMHNKFLCIKLT